MSRKTSIKHKVKARLRVVASADVLPAEDPEHVVADAAAQPLVGQAGPLEVVPAHRGRGEAAGVALDGLNENSQSINLGLNFGLTSS